MHHLALNILRVILLNELIVSMLNIEPIDRAKKYILEEVFRLLILAIDFCRDCCVVGHVRELKFVKSHISKTMLKLNFKPKWSIFILNPLQRTGTFAS
jgi:hypothetical protein